jgi:hypothetical protein
MDNHVKVSDNTLFAIDSMGQELAMKAAYVRGGKVVGIQTIDNRVIESGFAVYTGRDFLKLEGVSTVIWEGSVIRLNKFDDSPWKLCKGWYSVNGNPEIWGWYLESIPAGQIRSLQFRDLTTIEVISECCGQDGVDRLPFNIFVNNEPADRVGNDFYLTVPLFKVSNVVTSQSDFEYSSLISAFVCRENGHLELDELPVYVGQRVLVAGTANITSAEDLANNGIYVVTDTGTETSAAILSRANDFVVGDAITNATILVTDGEYGNTRWNLMTNTPIIPDETSLIFIPEGKVEIYCEDIEVGTEPENGEPII